MGLLSQEFEHATVVSVGHRSELEALHGRKIVLQRGRQGAKLVSDFCRLPKPVLPSGRPRMSLLSRWNSSLAHRGRAGLKDVNKAMRSEQGCPCACAATGHAAAAPPRMMMNSRRFMGAYPKAEDH
jgi:hypothetical protein